MIVCVIVHVCVCTCDVHVMCVHVVMHVFVCVYTCSCGGREVMHVCCGICVCTTAFHKLVPLYYCCISLQWEEFFDQMKPVLATLPYMVCPGNHESDSKNSE